MSIELPTKVKPIGFWNIIRRMGFNKFLGWVFVTSFAWSLQPWFLSGNVLDLKQFSIPLFLTVRYFFAILIFLILGIVGAFLIKNFSVNLKSYLVEFKNRRLYLHAIAMGLFMFLSRLLELYSYGENDNYAIFGMIFSILMVVFWDFKKWVLYFLTKKRTGPISIFVRVHLSKNLESPLEFITWLLQSILVFFAAVLFLYGVEGKLPDLGSGVIWSLGFALLSSLFLSLFYDFISPINETTDSISNNLPGNSNTAAFSNVFFTQLLASCMLLLFSTLWWLCDQLFFDNLGVVTSLKVGVNIVLGWNMYDQALFFVGYIAVVTVIGYFAEHIFLNLYDQNHKYGTWRIRGREWASITASFDPFLSAGIVIPVAIKLGVEIGESPPADIYWVFLSSFGIIAIALLLFMKVWSQKVEVLRTATFAQIAEISVQLDQFPKKFMWLAHTILYKTPTLPSLNFRSLSNGEFFSKDMIEAINHLLRFHGYNAFGLEKIDYQIFLVGGGKFLFDKNNHEAVILWQEFKENLAEQNIEILSLQDIKDLCDDQSVKFGGRIGQHVLNLDKELSEILKRHSKDGTHAYVAFEAFRIPKRLLQNSIKPKPVFVSYLFAQRQVSKLENYKMAIFNIMDTRVAKRALAKWGKKVANGTGSNSNPTTSDFHSFGYEDDDFVIDANSFIPFNGRTNAFSDKLEKTPPNSVVIVDETILLQLFEPENKTLFGLFIQATFGKYVLVRSVETASLFFRIATQGYEKALLSSLPCIEYGRKIIGEPREKSKDHLSRLILSAKLRSTLRPSICILSSDDDFENENFSLDSSLMTACVGMSPEISRPKKLEEFRKIVVQERPVFVIFSTTLDSYSEDARLIDGYEEILKHTNIDPYLLVDRYVDDIENLWPLNRIILRNQNSVAIAISKYCGLESTTNFSDANLENSMKHIQNFVNDYEKIRIENDFSKFVYFLFDYVITAGKRLKIEE